MSKRPLPSDIPDQPPFEGRPRQIEGGEKDEEYDADDFGILDDADVDLDLLLSLADDVNITQVTETELSDLITQLQQSIDHNAVEHQKHYNNPMNFMESELAVYEHLQMLQNRFPTEAHLYPQFIQLQGVQLLLSILFHENVDIGISVVRFITDMLNADQSPAPLPADFRKHGYVKGGIRNASYHHALTQDGALSDGIPYDFSPIMESCRSHASYLANNQTTTTTTTTTSTTHQDHSVKRYGFSWAVVVALFQCNGFRLLFSFLLTLNTQKESHHTAVYGFLEVLEGILTSTTVFNTYFCENNIVQFLVLRACFNHSLTIDTSITTASGQQASPGTLSVKDLQRLKKFRVSNQLVLKEAIDPINGMSTVRLYCLEVLLVLCEDMVNVAEEVCRTKEYYALPVNDPRFHITTPTDASLSSSSTTTTTTTTAGTAPHTSNNKTHIDITPPQQVKKAVFSLIEPLYQTTSILSRDALSNHPVLSPHSLLDLLLQLYHALIKHSSQHTLDPEQREFLWTLTNVVQAHLLHTRTLSSIVYPSHASLSSGDTSTPQQQQQQQQQSPSQSSSPLQPNIRHLFCHYDGVYLLLLGLRSKVCLTALTMLEAGCDCDDIIDIRIASQANPGGHIDTLEAITTYSILCNRVVEQGGIPLLFGYLQQPPSIKAKDERATFNRLLYSLHSHLILNTTSQRQQEQDESSSSSSPSPSPSPSPPPPLLRVLAKYCEKNYAKIRLLIQRLKTELEQFYTVLSADPEYSTLVGSDINLGYSPITAEVFNLSSTSNDEDRVKLTHSTPVILGRPPFTTVVRIPIHDPDFVLLGVEHGFKSANRICTIIVTVYALLVATRAGGEGESQGGEEYRTKFTSIFEECGVDPSIVFTIVAESTFYAGEDTLYGSQLASTLEYFLPFTPFAASTVPAATSTTPVGPSDAALVSNEDIQE